MYDMASNEEEAYYIPQIEEMFRQTKLELMITALFNERFTLKESQLHDDISNYVRGGEYSVTVTDKNNLTKIKKIEDVSVRRSYLRLFHERDKYVMRRKNAK